MHQQATNISFPIKARFIKSLAPQAEISGTHFHPLVTFEASNPGWLKTRSS